METIVFKTNMKCSGCIAKVTPVLDELAGKDRWFVDLEHLDKTLTVQCEKILEGRILPAVESAGFRIEKL